MGGNIVGRFCTAWIVLFLVNSSPGLTQSVAVGVRPETADRALVTVRVTDMPLTEVLEKIAAQARLHLFWSGQISKSSVRVTMTVRDVPAAEAFAKALSGTGMRAEISSGAVVFMRDASSVPVAQGGITGKVIDGKTRHGLRGATVSISGTNGGINKGTATSDDGSFRFSGVVPGPYTVQVRMLGYVRSTKTVTVTEGQTVSIDVALEPSVNALDQVIVTGTVVETERKAIPSAITVITAAEIESRGIVRIDQLFRGDVPGMFAPNLGSGSLLDSVVVYSRGSTKITGSASASTNPIKTYVDGIELANPAFLSQIDPRSIERIEILTGPQASTIYGSNAINGVMQIFTKRGTSARPQATVSLTSGLIQNNFSDALTPQHTYDARITGVEGRLAYNLGGSWDYMGAWTPAKQTSRLSGYGGGRMQTGILTLDASARQGMTRNIQRGGANQRSAAWVASGESSYNSTWAGVTAPARSTARGTTFGLTVGLVPTSWWSHSLTLGVDASNQETLALEPGYYIRSDSSRKWSQSTSARLSQRYTSTAQVPLAALGVLTATFGVDHWGTRTRLVSGSGTVLTGQLGSPVVTRGKPGKNTGAFVQGQWGIHESLFLTYGLRGEWNPSYGNAAQPNLAPRAGLAYTRELETPLGLVTAKVRGSYGRATRPPTDNQKLGDLVVNDAQYGTWWYRFPNDELVPESQQGGEGGVELYFGMRGMLTVTRFNQTVDQLIFNVGKVDSVRSLEPNPTIKEGQLDAEGYGYRGQSKNVNVGSIRNQGWELQGSVNMGPFTTRGTYSWNTSRVLGTTGAYRRLATSSLLVPGYSIGTAPEHTWAASVQYARSATAVSLNLTGMGFHYLFESQRKVLNQTNVARLITYLPRIGDISSRALAKSNMMADMNATHRFAKSVEGVLQIQNLSNVYQNDYSELLATVGRQTKVGLRIRMN